MLWDHEIFTFDWAPEGQTLDERGAAIVEQLTAVLQAGAGSMDFRIGETDSGPALQAGSRTILVVHDADAVLHGTTPTSLSYSVLDHVDSALFAERLSRW
jgi:hypothetical protein